MQDDRDEMFKDAVVFAKLDINSPMDNSTGNIIDTQKINEAVESISWCFDNGAYAVVVLSHQGRKKEESFNKHADILKNYFPVLFTKRHGQEVIDAVNNASRGTVILLENVRSDDEEKDYSDVAQTKLYQTLKSVEKETGRKIIYVKDDFAVCHRRDLSVYGLPLQLRKEGYPIVPGPMMKKEFEKAKIAREKIRNGNVIAIWSGKKFEDYLHLFQPFLEKHPNSIVLTAGPLSILLQKAMGHDVGRNEKFFEVTEELVAQVLPILKNFKSRIFTPVDYYVSDQDGKKVVSSSSTDDIIVDIGPQTVALYTNIIKQNPNSVVLGNGPLGEYEKVENRGGTINVYMEVFKAGNNFVIGGGGDFNAVMNILNLTPHISSAGGKAFLEFIVNGHMPGLEPCGIEVVE